MSDRSRRATVHGKGWLRSIAVKLALLGLVLVGLRTGVAEPQLALASSRVTTLSESRLARAENETSTVPKGCPKPNSLSWNQQSDGSFSLCVRVPASAQRATYLEVRSFGSYLKVPASLKNVIRTPAPVRLLLTPSSGPPGTKVTVRGTLLSGTKGPGSSYIDLCWNGCRSGLTYQGVRAHWSSSTTFTTTLRVPAAPWIQREKGSFAIHRLTSGTYNLGVVCVRTSRGCALGRSAGSKAFSLTVPRSYQVCGGHPYCDSVKLSSKSAYPGELVRVQGWAPLNQIIGNPFGYSVDFARSDASPNSIRVIAQAPNPNFRVLQLPTPRLQVRPELRWDNLPSLQVLHEQADGYTAVALLNASTNQYLWCGPGGVLSGRPGTNHPTVISSNAVAAALTGSGYSIESSSVQAPACQAVAVNPSQPSVIDASFSVVQGSVADAGGPPFAEVALQTTNGGASWSMIPAPSGVSPETFGGFVRQGGTIVAVYAANNLSGVSAHGTVTSQHGGVVPVSVSSPTGTSWSSGSLTCPLQGPCLRFSSASLGNCAMNGVQQDLLLGTSSQSTERFHDLGWPSGANSCYPAAIASVGRSSALFVDAGSSFALRISTDGGNRWASIALPVLPGSGSGSGNGGALLGAQSVVLTSHGTLLALGPVGTKGFADGAYLLKPRSSRWCRVVGGPLHDLTNGGSPGRLHLIGNELVMRINGVSSGGSVSAVGLLQVPVSTLRC